MKTTVLSSSPQAWLLNEFESLKSRNARFTLRAMAMRLKLSPGRLSEFLSGKRRITARTAEQIAQRLGLDPQRRAEFVESAKETASKPIVPDYLRLELDQFSIIADWYHFAILSLMETRDFQPSTPWIAKRLCLSPIQVKSAVHRLQRLGLIVIDGAEWRSTGRNIETPTDIASSALRKSHRQDLLRAIDALDGVAIEDRDVTSITMAIDSKKLPEAKKRIRQFRKELAAFLESGEQNEVYSLNLQLIPMSKVSKRSP